MPLECFAKQLGYPRSVCFLRKKYITSYMKTLSRSLKVHCRVDIIADNVIFTMSGHHAYRYYVIISQFSKYSSSFNDLEDNQYITRFLFLYHKAQQLLHGRKLPLNLFYSTESYQ